MRINNWAFQALLTLFCLIFTVNILAQEKKTLRAEDYQLWKASPNIVAAETSEDGKWYAYHTGNDSCVKISLKKIDGGPIYHFTAKANPNQDMSFSFEVKSNFSQDSKHYAFISNDSLHLVELKSGKVHSFKGLKNFRFVGEGQYLFAEGNVTKDKSIWLRDLNNHKMITINRVDQFSIDPTRRKVAVIIAGGSQTEVREISLKPGFPSSLVAGHKENKFSKLTWNKAGSAFAFVETKGIQNRDTVDKLHVCTYFGGKPILKSLNPWIGMDLPNSYTLLASDRLYVSADEGKLFFYATKETLPDTKSGIEIWLPTDPILSPTARKTRDDRQLWYQWSLGSNKVLAVTDTKYTSARLTGDDKHALIYHKRGYLPSYKYVNDFMDVYIKNLTTGNTKLLLEKVWDQPNQLSISPGGKYIAYYKGKNWWAYDILQDKHRCLTEGSNMTIENADLNRPGTVPPYGSPGWLSNDNELIVYDKNDIWLLSADGRKKAKITNGSETNQTFRVSVPSNTREASPGPGESFFKSPSYNAREGIVVKSVNNDNLENGLLLWTYQSGLRKLVKGQKQFNYFGAIKSQKPFLLTESNFSLPPRLMLYHPDGKTEPLFETDPHQKEFKWGKSELVHFNTPDGKRLKGALFYPADYVKGKRYPMVVEIYDKMSNHLHDYQKPSLAIGEFETDVNIPIYTSEGYLVFLPDMAYELNDPGISATKCVVAGVEKVIEMGLADRENIGLIGGSFGGYESAFIATQTNLIKTAVPMCGITDLSSWPLLISQFGPNFTRVEEDQFRMTGKFLGEDYKRNSPMNYIHQMNTPILLISGDKDPNVDVSQSKTFHNALWRMGKPSTMLIYKGEGHAFINPDNQLDAARRIKNWFDHHLKGAPKADWMVDGRQ